jgi:hypothetical protein
MLEAFPEVRIEGKPPCVICLSEIEGKGRMLQCGHCFHADCILTWWTHTPRTTLECPTCKHIQTLSHSPIDVEAVQTGPTELSSEALDQSTDLPGDVVGHQSDIQYCI